MTALEVIELMIKDIEREPQIDEATRKMVREAIMRGYSARNCCGAVANSPDNIGHTALVKEQND